MDITEEEIDDFLKKVKEETEKKKILSTIEKHKSHLVGSNINPHIQIVKAPTPEKTIQIIEQNENNKIKSNIQASSIHASSLKPTRDYSSINESLNLIKKRIMFHLDLAKSIKHLTKSVYTMTFVYVLIYHIKNIVDNALQILSGEQTCPGFSPTLWSDFMASHDHSIHTDNFVRISEKVYRLLYNSYERLVHLKDAGSDNPNLLEASKLIYDPEDEEVGDLTETIDTLMVGLAMSLEKRLTSVAAVKLQKMDPAHIRKVQLKMDVCRMMNLLGVFAEKEVYQEFELDNLIEVADSLKDDSDILNHTIALNDYLLSVDRAKTN